jgi:hypothetical protein
MARKKTSRTTGVRNPYFVAELLLGKRINWGKKSHQTRKKILEKAFGMPYHELFDPRYGSSLFVPPKPKTDILDLHTGDLTPCDPFPCPTPTSADWLRYKDAAGNYGQYTVDGRIYSDPIQGCLPDCFFIAALSSYAFAPPPNAWITKNQTVNPYKFQFWSPPQVIGGPTIKDTLTPVTDKLPLKANQLIHARSIPDKEIWPNLWEKAYATWNWWVSGGKQVGQYNDSPAYNIICKGNPYLALLNLTGLKYDNTNWLTTDPVFGSDPTVPAGQAIYNKIATTLCQNTTIAKKPAVAMTYDPLTDPVPAGVTYSDTTIVANHSYSLLGVYTQASTGDKYIVLRNPWGQKAGAGDPVLTGSQLAVGSWNGVTLDYRGDGIFGLLIDKFQTHFKGFGWVV